MSSNIERLMRSTEIKSWFSTFDPKLLAATGEYEQTGGGQVKENWDLKEKQSTMPIVAKVMGLLIRPSLPLVGRIKADFSSKRGAVMLDFLDERDWRTHFPREEEFEVDAFDDERAWAGVASCETLALGIFARDMIAEPVAYRSEPAWVGIRAFVKPVRPEVFEALRS